MSDREYLTSIKYGIDAESIYQIEKAESKGCESRKFFKVDDEGFIYVADDRPDILDKGIE